MRLYNVNFNMSDKDDTIVVFSAFFFDLFDPTEMERFLKGERKDGVCDAGWKQSASFRLTIPV